MRAENNSYTGRMSFTTVMLKEHTWRTVQLGKQLRSVPLMTKEPWRHQWNFIPYILRFHELLLQSV